ncbi:MAG: endolytic transglycosylase MltG [Candidatus Yanofskybacteria bacterium]|nr:endolytic transglycosylase MltG [Candidatus Yanofskybacteria bacterium]
MPSKAFFFLMCAVFLGIFAWYGLFTPTQSSSSEHELFTITPGETNKEIATALKDQGYIRFSMLLRVWALTTGVSGYLQAGEYALSKSMTPLEILRKFYLGDVVKETITIPEGWNLRNIAEYFENRGLGTQQEIFSLVGYPGIDYRTGIDLPKLQDMASEFEFLSSKPAHVSLEGYLFPDTYEIRKGETREAIVRRMLARFGAQFGAQLRAEAAARGKTVFEIVTMASLLEKEVKSYEDKQIVSGLLLKRLQAGMPLQVDATIAYITGKNTTAISLAETRIDSPYNTYLYRGLPLGPIGNPGIESIRAALYPQESPYWFYLSTPDGETVFSRTHEEHVAAKAQYLR